MSGSEAIIHGRDPLLAIGLLTRLPVRTDASFSARRGSKAAWAYPLAGALVALAAGGVGWNAIALCAPTTIAAGIVLAIQVILTGAMHEDGLADSADGLWGGWDQTRRLEIMKDSHIGSYGVLALIGSLGLRWSALVALGPALFPVLIGAALLSRAGMVAVMAVLPNAREGGLSRSVGRPSFKTATLCSALALVLSWIAAPGLTPVMLVATILGTLICIAIARKKIGGQTGDILGATQQVTECLSLIAAAVIIG